MSKPEPNPVRSLTILPWRTMEEFSPVGIKHNEMVWGYGVYDPDRPLFSSVYIVYNIDNKKWYDLAGNVFYPSAWVLCFKKPNFAWQATHRHVKTGKHYRVLFPSIKDVTNDEAVNNVVYDDYLGNVFTQRASRFYGQTEDGKERFEVLVENKDE